MEGSEGMDATCSSLTGPQFELLANTLAQLLETAKRELERDHEAAKALLITASSILESEIEFRSQSSTNRTRAALSGWQVSRVKAFIETNLHQTIRSEDLSIVARRSVSHFSRAFKLTFGEPPHAYVTRKRLEKCCYLMMASAASLTEIAHSSGFADQAHFCRHFRQAYGESPSDWRRNRGVPPCRPTSLTCGYSK